MCTEESALRPPHSDLPTLPSWSTTWDTNAPHLMATPGLRSSAPVPVRTFPLFLSTCTLLPPFPTNATVMAAVTVRLCEVFTAC